MERLDAEFASALRALNHFGKQGGAYAGYEQGEGDEAANQPAQSDSQGNMAIECMAQSDVAMCEQKFLIVS